MRDRKENMKALSEEELENVTGGHEGCTIKPKNTNNVLTSSPKNNDTDGKTNLCATKSR